MFRFSDWPCSGAARLTFRRGITAPGRAVFRPLNAPCVTQSAHPVQHVTPPVRNDPDRHHKYIASPDPAPPQRPCYGRTVGNLGQHRRPRCTSQPAEGTDVAAPDTIAKLIRGVVFLDGNDWHRAGLPRRRALIRQPLGDRGRNQEQSASALARRYVASRAVDSASSTAACAKSIASNA